MSKLAQKLLTSKKARTKKAAKKAAIDPQPMATPWLG